MHVNCAAAPLLIKSNTHKLLKPSQPCQFSECVFFFFSPTQLQDKLGVDS